MLIAIHVQPFFGAGVVAVGGQTHQCVAVAVPGPVIAPAGVVAIAGVVAAVVEVGDEVILLGLAHLTVAPIEHQGDVAGA